MKKALLITVDVEEWYHSEWFNIDKIIRNTSVDPPVLGENDLDPLLDMFRNLRVKSTFFILGEIAERVPGLAERIAMEGHEIGCHGYDHNSIYRMDELEFRLQVEKNRAAIRKAVKEEPLGYRAPNFQITPWAMNLLEDLGFFYDSSIVPCLKIPGWYGHPHAPLVPYRPCRDDMYKEDLEKNFFEIPIAVSPILRLPGGGGWYLRNFGYTWVKTIAKALLKKGPVTIYVHPWEILDNLPNCNNIPFHVFRRTGSYVRKAVKDLVKSLRTQPLSIRDFLEKEGW